MTKVFIGGSRRITKLSTDVCRRLNRIIERRLPVLIGDANGADRAAQQYLHSKGYRLVEVFCAGGECRNNLGGWPVRAVPANGRHKDRSFYAAKDRVMTAEASLGLMIWDGKSVGTLMNVLRLVRQHKKVVGYIAPTKEFVDLKDETDFQRLVACCAPDLRRRVQREAATEQQDERTPTQASLL